MAERDGSFLNEVYREISERLGMDATLEIYHLFRGQQVCFPVRLFHPKHIRQRIVQEYDGTNVRALAIKYRYSEKTIRRMLREAKQEAETRREDET